MVAFLLSCASVTCRQVGHEPAPNANTPRARARTGQDSAHRTGWARTSIVRRLACSADGRRQAGQRCHRALAEKCEGRIGGHQTGSNPPLEWTVGFGQRAVCSPRCVGAVDRPSAAGAQFGWGRRAAWARCGAAQGVDLTNFTADQLSSGEVSREEGVAQRVAQRVSSLGGAIRAYETGVLQPVAN